MYKIFDAKCHSLLMPFPTYRTHALLTFISRSHCIHWTDFPLNYAKSVASKTPLVKQVPPEV